MMEYDNSWTIIEGFAQQNPNVKGVRFEKFWKIAGLACWFC
jgi:hypothetical protein